MKLNYLFWSLAERFIIKLVFDGSMMNMAKRNMDSQKKWKAILWKINQRKQLSKLSSTLRKESQ